jgi:ElaB/YqjD/DUF883 family membrane-anchored ribosome-binding protein
MIHLLGGRGSMKETAEDQAAEMASWLRRSSRQAYEKVEQLVTEHPAAALVAALGIGVVAGWIIKRRK